jgi:hypothetical protein
MFVTQISVFLENSPGRLAEFTKLLKDNNIDLVSLSIGDTTDFGIIRAVMSDTEKAMKVITEAGYTARLNDVLAAEVPDCPGGLFSVVKTLAEAGISIEYLYSFVRSEGKNAVIIFRVQELERGAAVLEKSGVHILTNEEVRSL